VKKEILASLMSSCLASRCPQRQESRVKMSWTLVWYWWLLINVKVVEIEIRKHWILLSGDPSTLDFQTVKSSVSKTMTLFPAKNNNLQNKKSNNNFQVPKHRNCLFVMFFFATVFCSTMQATQELNHF